MKNLSLILIAFSLVFIFSCAEDEKDSDALPKLEELEKKPVTQEVVNDSIINNQQENIDKTVSIDKSNNLEETTEERELKTAKDIDNHLSGNINSKHNPDNLNMTFDEKRRHSNIKLHPLLFNDEKSHYFVQFLVTVNKKNIEYFEDIFSDETNIYVTSHLGLYKYSIAKYNTEDEARQGLDSVNKLYDLDDLQIAYYGEAF